MVSYRVEKKITFHFREKRIFEKLFVHQILSNETFRGNAHFADILETVLRNFAEFFPKYKNKDKFHLLTRISVFHENPLFLSVTYTGPDP